MTIAPPLVGASPALARLGAVSAWVAVVFNVAGVVAVRPIPPAYKPGALTAWLEGSLAHPEAAIASALAFTVGVLAFVPLAVALACVSEGPRIASRTLGVIALALAGTLGAAGTLLPFVAIGPLASVSGQPLQPAALALLATALTMDAFYNALLGIGLLCSGFAMLADPHRSRWLGWLGVIAGLLTLPVALQPVSRAAADWLVVAGPFWLAWLIWTGLSLWRQARSPA